MHEKKQEQVKEGLSKNENAFNKMKELMGGQKGVFEYKQPHIDIEEPEVELEEDEIKSDLEEEEPELEYSVEHLEDFMKDLNKNP